MMLVGCLVVLFSSFGICVACGLCLGWFSCPRVVFAVGWLVFDVVYCYIACAYVLVVDCCRCLGFALGLVC